MTGSAEEERDPRPRPGDTPEDLLRPREVAELLGVRTTTLARWAREGRIVPLFTPGGHRRYRRAAVRGLLEDSAAEEAEHPFADDAARLYEQGWSVRQVADRLGVTYGTMRRVLLGRTTLRPRGGGRI